MMHAIGYIVLGYLALHILCPLRRFFRDVLRDA